MLADRAREGAVELSRLGMGNSGGWRQRAWPRVGCGGRERHALAGQARLDADGDGEVVLPVAGGPQDDVLAHMEKVELAVRCERGSRLCGDLRE